MRLRSIGALGIASAAEPLGRVAVRAQSTAAAPKRCHMAPRAAARGADAAAVHLASCHERAVTLRRRTRSFLSCVHRRSSFVFATKNTQTSITLGYRVEKNNAPRVSFTPGYRTLQHARGALLRTPTVHCDAQQFAARREAQPARVTRVERRRARHARPATRDAIGCVAGPASRGVTELAAPPTAACNRRRSQRHTRHSIHKETRVSGPP